MIVLAPVAGVGTVLLLLALARWERLLGWALWLGGAAYVAAVVYKGGRIDGTAPLVALLLLLCGELAAWSLEGRWRIRSDEALVWRRTLTLAVLAAAGLAAAGLVVALSAVQPGHGLAWTAVGAVAAVGAAGTGAWLARR